MRRGPNFDRIARAYRWLEYLTFGRSLERCRFYFLQQLSGARSALVFGDGDGRFLHRLMTTSPGLAADAVDLSPAMLRLLEHRVQDGARLKTHCMPALSFQPLRTYDAVATHFFLDCLTQQELETLCSRVAANLEAGGLWVVSEFQIPNGPMHWPARILVRALYLAFRILTGLRTSTLPDHQTALRKAGMNRVARQTSLAGILTAELWQQSSDFSPKQISR